MGPKDQYRVKRLAVGAFAGWGSRNRVPVGVSRELNLCRGRDGNLRTGELSASSNTLVDRSIGLPMSVTGDGRQLGVSHKVRRSTFYVPQRRCMRGYGSDTRSARPQVAYGACN